MIKEKLKTKNIRTKSTANAVGVAPLGDPHIKNISTKPAANAVGAGLVSARKTKSAEAHSNLISNHKGITLIALIITIIVMLILVVVTVNVAIKGGLIGNAKEGAKETEKQTILEQIIAMGEWNEYGNIEVAETFGKVVEEFGEDKVSPNTITDDATEVEFEVKGKTGSFKYRITGSNIEIIEDIWQKRGLDTSIAGIIGTEYVFECDISLESGSVKLAKTKLNPDGSWMWGKEFENSENDFTVFDSDVIDTNIDSGAITITDNSITFPDAHFSENVTIVFENNTATLKVKGQEYKSK